MITQDRPRAFPVTRLDRLRPFRVTQLDILADLSRAINPDSPYGPEVARYWMRGMWLRVERVYSGRMSARASWHDLFLEGNGTRWQMWRMKGGERVVLHETRRASEAVACFFAEIALTEDEPEPEVVAEPPEVKHKPPPRLCKIEGCDRRHEAKGYCMAHYLRWRQGTDMDLPIGQRGGSRRRGPAY